MLVLTHKQQATLLAEPKVHYTMCTRAAPSAATPAPAPSQIAGPSGALPEAATPAAIPDQAPSGQSSLFTADVVPANSLKPGVYARGRHTQEVATAQLNRVTGGQR